MSNGEGAPAKKGLPVWAWIGIGCGALSILVLVVLMVGGFFVARKVQDVAADFEENPAMATARMIVKLNPELEEVATDEEAGTITVRNRKTGEVITVNFEEGCSVTWENIGFPFQCHTDITALTMIWDGTADPIQLKAWYGNVGSTLLLDQSGISIGDEVTVSGYAGSPNDVYWEIYSGGTKLGESKFHLSCSDNDMNAAEDCGKRQGNGKSNESGLINDWILEGMVDADGPFDCSNLP